MVLIDGILWTTRGKKLIDPDSVKKWSEVEKQKRNHQNNSKGFQTNRTKSNWCSWMHHDTKCYWLPFWLHMVFWLSREAVTIFAVDRHPGVTRIFDASLNYRQTSRMILLDPSMVAIKQIVPQLTRMCQEIWHDQGELWKQCWSVTRQRQEIQQNASGMSISCGSMS